MRLPRFRVLLLLPIVLFAVFYVVALLVVQLGGEPGMEVVEDPEPYRSIAIFGASGTAGDGILKAALANPEIRDIHVVTRRATPRIEEGVAAGKVQVTRHMDYLDYGALHEQLAGVDAVYWAIGTSSIGVDEPAYRRIHVDFPLRFVTEWAQFSEKQRYSFHYISSSDISADSSAMWARVKFAAEQALFEFAGNSRLRVIAYRPDYIGPTREEAHFGQDMLYWFFAPVGAAVRAERIGEAMFEVTARGAEFSNGDTLVTRRIIRLSDAFERRQSSGLPRK